MRKTLIVNVLVDIILFSFSIKMYSNNLFRWLTIQNRVNLAFSYELSVFYIADSSRLKATE
jgi:hypothetical protein